ncbi:bifunctional DNA-formamidopyrimidine glycosylase/DNA-(apurinic or apyrimidinic site) lyase [Mariprofundus erugo]|uniref:bifunctional DNA-formamidopyrimidine glycosylase/DNA-(apurinic or apyrimidinic site) lyase n=1 Tax=Mariprofundus erugo TaxID=2528639 RepID=UPI0010FF0603|nr:bifunctional DNA-formamidopyrimidine glycosylase/DNA-(apurinic or apyrimidinic site) lyase [Mariprofundus erugo]TLS75756.1 bifunctional DNA-formamidopyrimidine glycosylase/DNA-(apurinic or apyrimidinic site) lyase [Mariprofundus erugo]
MPELPEVEVVCRGLAPVVGRSIVGVSCHRTGLRYPLPDLAGLAGCRVTAIRRRAKYLLFELDDGRVLIWHLGMTGQFHLLATQAPAALHEHVQLNLDDGRSLRYRDARRFGYAGLMAAADVMDHPWFARLGPEPLGDDFDAAYLLAFCRGRKAPVKSVIMDAGCVVGVGNIYAAESLFRAGIHPARAAGRISQQRLAALVLAIRQVLAEAINAGGSTISDFVKADGKPGYFAHSFQVYGREGEPCLRCGTVIRRMVQSGRSSFYCPDCQH